MEAAEEERAQILAEKRQEEKRREEARCHNIPDVFPPICDKI